MSNRFFWIIFIMIYTLLSFSQPISWAAYVAFYIPPTLVITWLIFWYVQFINQNVTDVLIFTKIQNGVEKFFYTVLILSFTYALGLIGIALIKSNQTTTIRGSIYSISRQHFPFIRNYNLKLIKIQKLDGATLVVLPRYNPNFSFWLNQKVKLEIPLKYTLTAHIFEFDSFTWHLNIIKRWPSAKKSWQIVMNSLYEEYPFEELLQWVTPYTRAFGADDYLLSLGNRYWLNNNLKQTTLFFEAAFKAAPGDYNIMKYLGFYLAKSGKKEEGIILLQKAIQIQPDNFEAFYQLSHVLMETDKKSEAIPILERTLELNPHLSDIKSALNRLKHFSKKN